VNEPQGIRVRRGTSADVPAVIALFDEAIEWLASSGRAGQWGTEPWSAQPRRVGQIRQFADSGGLRIADAGGVVAGAVKLGAAPGYVPAAQEPELYLDGFVVGRRFAGHGVGRVLLSHACAEAADLGAAVVRLDCWAGGDQALVRYYQRAGFTAAGRFRVGQGWEGQILIRRLPPSADPAARVENH
jgi:GNAT superfamily N-acetyltransferase